MTIVCIPAYCTKKKKKNRESKQSTEESNYLYSNLILKTNQIGI